MFGKFLAVILTIVVASGWAGPAQAFQTQNGGQEAQPDCSQIKQKPSYYAFCFTAGCDRESRSWQQAVERAVARFSADVRLVKARVDDPLNDEFVEAVGVQQVPLVIIVTSGGDRVKTLAGLSECLSLGTVLYALLPAGVALASAAAGAPGQPVVAFSREHPKEDNLAN